METQNYANHRQSVFLYHRVLLPVVALTFIGSIVNLIQSWGNHERIYSASLIVVLTLCMAVATLFARIFPLKAQDRAIRAEENLRYFVLTGKLPDPRLTVRQIVALRFAPDTELVALANRAADESLAPDDIKRAIKNWRADTYRA